MPFRSLQLIRSLGLRFWLLLPLLGGLAWVVSGWATDWTLNQARGSETAFVIEAPSDSPAIVVQAINVAIQSNTAIVIVTTLNQPLRRLEFRFPYSDPETLERSIAQVLGLSQAQVRQIIQY